ncbi:piggyBac transposable element-derived protein 4-like [Eupeodes corollae]|uniref:piggyBac transposable element-derived protein 4-like n=1 Tax=Eupeodes corollae TaxID=290404 RepID=UPI00248FDA25|nr:piggyBac transposable element-derived protein 4-like [Eupeodes corollae]
MYMGIVKYPSIAHYWNTGNFFKNSFVPKVMSRNRFQLILKFIHFADNSAFRGNRLGKVSTLLELLERNFVNARTPNEILALDESMIPWRGRLQFRQYSPGKSHKYGVKVYKLWDPYGYTYTSSIYAGKTESNIQRGRPTPTTSYSTQIVLDLAEKYLDQGRTIATDNFYTSVSLAKHLLDRQTHLFGTLRNSRTGNPKEVTNAKLKKHEVKGMEDSGIVIAKWKDKRDVLMLSTKHGLEEVGTGKRNRDGQEIKKLRMIVDYNHAKQGIDISDQMACYFTPLRKTIRWYHKIAFEFF